MSPLRCADSSLERDEPLYGTASIVHRWLLLEQPGAWGYDAMRRSRLPERIATELRKRARAAGVRVILLRRGSRFSDKERQCYFARTEESDSYLAHASVSTVEDLLDFDLGALKEGRSVPGAVEQHDSLFLVCTHGRHDACCSIRGNQVARIACATGEVDAWECSHIGGDRFAANLVCFPHGVYYGRVAAEEVQGLMEAYAEGIVSLDHYRGRCCYGFALQAAEYFARRETRTLGVSDVSLLTRAVSAEELTATFELSGGRRAAVTVSISAGERSHRLTCRATEAYPIPLYELVSCTMD